MQQEIEKTLSKFTRLPFSPFPQSGIRVKCILDELKKNFLTQFTKPLDWRIQQLKALKRGMEEKEKEIQEAFEKDLGRNEFMTWFCEMKGVIDGCQHQIDCLPQWIKDEHIDTPLLAAPARCRIRYEPLGVALVMGAWNFPFVTHIEPLSNAISAGCCAIIKPSEVSVHVTKVMTDLIEQYLDKRAFRVVQGGPDVASHITTLPFDVIAYTGSPQKAKFVAAAAAKHLVPTILELGGKCPVVVDETADPVWAAKKVGFGRYFNHGQVCLASDYVLVHQKQKEKFLNALKQTLADYYSGEDHKAGMGCMINAMHTDRVLGYLKEDHGGKILYGGEGDAQTRLIQPTVVVDPRKDSQIMTEEIFGPILSVITFGDFQEALDHINSGEKPLAAYYFGSVNGKNKERFINETSSGAVCINDVVMQKTNSSLPFGGVGNSGMRRLQGKLGFQSFCNPKSVMVKPTMNIPPFNKLLFPPFTKEKIAEIKKTAGMMKGTQDGVLQILTYVALVVLVLLLYRCSGCFGSAQAAPQGDL